MKQGITQSPYSFTGDDIAGEGLKTGLRTLGDLAGIFADEKAYAAMDKGITAYNVKSIEPDPQGTPGGLYMGITYLESGKVGDEYFMTKGHFHQNPYSAECYWGVKGHGMLILMDHKRNTWAEEMLPGTLHYIQAGIAHRVANVGDEELVFSACWPSDAGHDYETIAYNGFACRLLKIDGVPKLI